MKIDDIIVDNILNNNNCLSLLLFSIFFVGVSMLIWLLAHKKESSTMLDFSWFFLLLSVMSLVVLLTEIGLNPVSLALILFAILGGTTIYLAHLEYPDPVRHEEETVEI
ncbi:MAG: hypothetical protein H6779_02080 [Candidatus Nomurabacteria bacterium]|nr:hypothetical protein [Candidatus Nomurabacteria bacterium]USN88213.1 MAG: hypothetical protein H6779_02080 [Candidatus Nomurabacteria bacterium]